MEGFAKGGGWGPGRQIPQPPLACGAGGPLNGRTKQTPPLANPTKNLRRFLLLQEKGAGRGGGRLGIDFSRESGEGKNYPRKKSVWLRGQVYKKAKRAGRPTFYSKPFGEFFGGWRKKQNVNSPTPRGCNYTCIREGRRVCDLAYSHGSACLHTAEPADQPLHLTSFCLLRTVCRSHAYPNEWTDVLDVRGRGFHYPLNSLWRRFLWVSLPG